LIQGGKEARIEVKEVKDYQVVAYVNQNAKRNTSSLYCRLIPEIHIENK